MKTDLEMAVELCCAFIHNGVEIRYVTGKAINAFETLKRQYPREEKIAKLPNK